MTQNTTIKPVSSAVTRMFSIACKKAGLSSSDINDPKVKSFIRKRKAELQAATELKATKEFYLQHIAKPFEDYSIYDDDSLKSANFSNYDKSFSKEAKTNYYKAGNITKEYCDGKEFNTFLIGPCGRGKSHLALSILKSVLRIKRPLNSGVFVDVNEMMQKIKDSFDTDQPLKKQIEHHLQNAYLIVLDDLGAESVTDFDIEVLLEIINSNHRIIFTTNLMPDEIKKDYGERVYSRMRRGIKGHVIQFTDATGDHREM